MGIHISNSDDLIDSRDVIARIAELDTERDEAEDAELAALKALAEDANAPLGSLLIRDSYFRDYAQDFASEIGIGWEQAKHKLQRDYRPLSFRGVGYWIRQSLRDAADC